MENKKEFLKTEKEIVDWLNKYGVESYTLIPDEKYRFVVDIDGDVDLDCKNLDFIPVKFNIVNGGFYCSKNQLTSLEFCPKFVDGDFFCYNNKIKNYIYFPEEIGDEIYLNNEKSYSFEEAYKIHLKDKAEYEKQLLNENIKSNKIDKNNNSFKI